MLSYFRTRLDSFSQMFLEQKMREKEKGRKMVKADDITESCYRAALSQETTVTPFRKEEFLHLLLIEVVG